MGRTVAFVLGSPRSGSTLLGAMLGSHRDAMMLGEMNRYARDVRGRAGRRLCLICEGRCPVWDDAVPKHFRWRRFGPTGAAWQRLPAVRGFYEELFEATGARVLVDTSKYPDWARRRLAQRRDWRGAAARIVYITRDGRGAVNSWARKRPKVPFEAHLRNWVKAIEQIERFFAATPPEARLRLRYEDLVDRPEATLAAACDGLGLDHQPGMAEYWRHEHHLINGNAGTRSLINRWRVEHGIGARGATSKRRGSIYDEAGFALFRDERWRDEMSADELARFEAQVGALNRRLGYE